MNITEYLQRKDRYNMEFEEFLIQILNRYDISWQEDPLDSDEVDTLVEHLRNQLNLINGNITRAEYEQREA